MLDLIPFLLPLIPAYLASRFLGRQFWFPVLALGLVLVLNLKASAQQFEPRGHTTPDNPARFHSLCFVTRSIQTLPVACRIEDARREGFENFYRVELMSPWLGLEEVERFETGVTVAALETGNLRVVIEHWGHILMIPLDANIRETWRKASSIPTPTGVGAETITQGVTVKAVGDGQYTIVFDHVGRGF